MTTPTDKWGREIRGNDLGIYDGKTLQIIQPGCALVTGETWSMTKAWEIVARNWTEPVPSPKSFMVARDSTGKPILPDSAPRYASGEVPASATEAEWPPRYYRDGQEVRVGDVCRHGSEGTEYVIAERKAADSWVMVWEGGVCPEYKDWDGKHWKVYSLLRRATPGPVDCPEPASPPPQAEPIPDLPSGTILLPSTKELRELTRCDVVDLWECSPWAHDPMRSESAAVLMFDGKAHVLRIDGAEANDELAKIDPALPPRKRDAQAVRSVIIRKAKEIRVKELGRIR